MQINQKDPFQILLREKAPISPREIFFLCQGVCFCTFVLPFPKVDRVMLTDKRGTGIPLYFVASRICNLFARFSVTLCVHSFFEVHVPWQGSGVIPKTCVTGSLEAGHHTQDGKECLGRAKANPGSSTRFDLTG